MKEHRMLIPPMFLSALLLLQLQRISNPIQSNPFYFRHLGPDSQPVLGYIGREHL